MKTINPPLSIKAETKESLMYIGLEYALLTLTIADEDLEKSGHLTCIKGSDDSDDYTIALGKVEGIAFHFIRYHSSPGYQAISGNEPLFSFHLDSDAFKNNKSKNFQPYVLAYRLLEQLEIPWDKVNWINPELQSPI